MKKICVITGSRAEYGLLSRVMRYIREDERLQLQVIATNMHLSAEFGMTYREIEADGFVIDKKVQMLLSSDTSNAVTKSVGLGTIGFADAYQELQPDLIVVLGDRSEILAAVTAALLYRIPVAHIHGGEITEGAYDDAIRHAVTKMSHLHFTSTEAYRQRVIQMGEQPATVFYVGSLGCDNIRDMQLMDKETLETSIGFGLDRNTLMVTFHPMTLGKVGAEKEFSELLAALDVIGNPRAVFTLPNSDAGGRVIIGLIEDYVAKHPGKSVAFPSLGAKRYLSALQYIGGVIGNSSSGVVEAPSFHIPTLNIGDRQRGRIMAESVLNCPADRNEIATGLQKVLNSGFRDSLLSVKNPYDKPGTARAIVDIIKTCEPGCGKSFYDLL